MLDLIAERQMESRVIISSFDHAAIQSVKRLNPEIETAALFMEVLVHPLDYLHKIPTDALHILFPAAIRPSIAEVIASGMPVRTFTVNDGNICKDVETSRSTSNLYRLSGENV